MVNHHGYSLWWLNTYVLKQNGKQMTLRICERNIFQGKMNPCDQHHLDPWGGFAEPTKPGTLVDEMPIYKWWLRLKTLVIDDSNDAEAKMFNMVNDTESGTIYSFLGFADRCVLRRRGISIAWHISHDVGISRTDVPARLVVSLLNRIISEWQLDANWRIPSIPMIEGPVTNHYKVGFPSYKLVNKPLDFCCTMIATRILNLNIAHDEMWTRTP